MRNMNDHGVDIPVVVVTAYGDMEKAAACIKAGAFDFLSKPVNIERLGVSLRNALHTKFLQHQVQSFERHRTGGVSFSQVIGNNVAFRACIAQATKAAHGSMPLLIRGESGSGKTLLARAIHGSSGRSRHPFVTLNCSMLMEPSGTLALDKNLSPAHGNKLYEKILEANHGTLYISGVCNLSLPQQVLLLRALQENELPMEGGRATPVDVRVISGSSRSLDILVQKGEFRGDLLHRLAHSMISLPALRDRRDDIHLLVEYFIRKYAASEFKTVRSISPSALGMLVSHPWQGNVRQLENKIFRAVALSKNSQLDIDDFDMLQRDEAADYRVHEHSSASPYHAPALENTSLMSLVGPSGHMKRMDQLEVEAIRYALQYYKGHMSEVARRLGIGRSTLYRKIHDFDIA